MVMGESGADRRRSHSGDAEDPAGGLEVTAIHNHILHESPRIMYMHIAGHGMRQSSRKQFMMRWPQPELPRNPAPATNENRPRHRKN